MEWGYFREFCLKLGDLKHTIIVRHSSWSGADLWSSYLWLIVWRLAELNDELGKLWALGERGGILVQHGKQSGKRGLFQGESSLNQGQDHTAHVFIPREHGTCIGRKCTVCNKDRLLYLKAGSLLLLTTYSKFQGPSPCYIAATDQVVTSYQHWPPLLLSTFKHLQTETCATSTSHGAAHNLILDFDIQRNLSIVATIGEQSFGLYRGVSLSQGFFFRHYYTESLNSGPRWVATIGRVASHQRWPLGGVSL